MLIFGAVLTGMVMSMNGIAYAGSDGVTIVVVREGFNDRIVVVERRPIFFGEDDLFFGEEEEEGFFFREEERPFFRREAGEREFFGGERDD